ncbi:MAG: hypothetical protein K8S00_11800 [Bacteroidales bacterium]|nr:hypothetical protein [Bacteroidales bacterium]
MQNITITPQIENGKFYIDLPDNIINSDFIIQIIVKKAEMKTEVLKPVDAETRIAKVRLFSGIAKSSTFRYEKDQWYHQ